MLEFDAAPAIRLDYFRLNILSKEESILAKNAGYIETIAVGVGVKRLGLDNCTEVGPEDSVRDWRIRIYLVWLCYIYEKFYQISDPMGAVSEILLEFKIPRIVDVPNRRMGNLYIGTGGVARNMQELAS